MPLEPTDPLAVTLAPSEWATVSIEVLTQATFDTARPMIEKIVAGTGNTVALYASEWNEVLALLRNGRYAVVAPLIQKIFNQANAVQTIAQVNNGVDSDEVRELKPGEFAQPSTRNRRQANLQANASG